MNTVHTPVGFIGLGVMGMPMALNLAQSGTSLCVWNRTSEKCARLAAAGAALAGSVDELFARCSTVLLMLANDGAVDAVLGRRGRSFVHRVAGHTIVHMGTTSPVYSDALSAEIVSAGGQYVESPVSGSRTPAEKGELVAMMSGETDVVARIRPLLAPMTSDTFVCGAVPNALLMKLAVNIFLITMVTGLAEALNFAQCQALDTQIFRSIVDVGPMASEVSTTKIKKMVHQDFAVQAACRDVLMNNRLIADAAKAARIPVPLLENCHALFEETVALRHGGLDMAAVLLALRERYARSCNTL